MSPTARRNVFLVFGAGLFAFLLWSFAGLSSGGFGAAYLPLISSQPVHASAIVPRIVRIPRTLAITSSAPMHAPAIRSL